MDIRLINFHKDSIKYVSPSWSEIDFLTFDIAQKINTDKKTFDRVVTLAKGGWPMARPLIDYVDVKKVASIGLKFYKGINERMGKPVVYQDLPVDVEGENILVFDDVADTGESLQFVCDYLKEKKVKSITTACLFFKPHSSIVPDYYARETNDWIIFPYELRETMSILVDKWESQGIDETEIIDRFVHLGFRRDRVEYFYTQLYR